MIGIRYLLACLLACQIHMMYCTYLVWKSKLKLCYIHACIHLFHVSSRGVLRRSIGTCTVHKVTIQKEVTQGKKKEIQSIKH